MEKFLYITPRYEDVKGLSIVVPEGVMTFETTAKGEVVITSIEGITKQIDEALKDKEFGHVSYFNDKQYVLNKDIKVEVTKVYSNGITIFKYTFVKRIIESYETTMSNGMLAHYRICANKVCGDYVYEYLEGGEDNADEIMSII
jgi:uncharacterized protein YqgQ